MKRFFFSVGRSAAAVLLVLMFIPWTAPRAFSAGTVPFTRSSRYQGFADVAEDSWYYESVRAAGEFGLMNGKSASVFDPDGEVTTAEGLTIACRLHAIYHRGTADFESTTPWYKAYLTYGRENDISYRVDVSDEAINRPLSRASFALLISNALPDDALKPVNTVEFGGIPDLVYDGYGLAFNAVYRLYRAGIMTGSDEKGTLMPDAPLKRSETAAVISRIADPTLRQSIELTVPGPAAASEEEVRSMISAVSPGETIRSLYYEDFDGDGGKEAVAVTVSGPEKNRKGRVWYTSGKGVPMLLFECLEGDGKYAGESLEDFGTVKVFRYGCFLDTDRTFRLFRVRKGLPERMLIPNYKTESTEDWQYTSVNNNYNIPHYDPELRAYVISVSLWGDYGHGFCENLIEYNPETDAFEWTKMRFYRQEGKSEWEPAPENKTVEWYTVRD